MTCDAMTGFAFASLVLAIFGGLALILWASNR